MDPARPPLSHFSTVSRNHTTLGAAKGPELDLQDAEKANTSQPMGRTAPRKAPKILRASPFGLLAPLCPFG